ncbi:MAG: hypothetical protein JSU04_19050 [Bdellovibrionales bacterium]|nr:hypothetical protein [Bdellovibrionales bacterium]
MKTLSQLLVLCLIFTACAQPGKDTSSPAAPVPPVSSDDIDYNAGLLSQTYATWKSETAALAWKESDPHAYELAEAYILGLRGPKYLGPTRPATLLWLLENFKTLQNPAPDSSEMKALAKAYINKDLNL